MHVSEHIPADDDEELEKQQSQVLLLGLQAIRGFLDALQQLVAQHLQDVVREERQHGRKLIWPGEKQTRWMKLISFIGPGEVVFFVITFLYHFIFQLFLKKHVLDIMPFTFLIYMLLFVTNCKALTHHCTLYAKAGLPSLTVTEAQSLVHFYI